MAKRKNSTSSRRIPVPAWFDDGLEKRLESVSLALRRGALPGGELRGVKRGGQLEFVEHRPYAVGDDLKRLDWNVYGRLGRLHVKTFAMEAAAQIDLLVDGSASMALSLPAHLVAGASRGSNPSTPYEAALLAASCIAYLALRGGRKGSAGGHRLRLAISDGRASSKLRWLSTHRGPAGFLALLAELAREPQRPPEEATAARFATAVREAEKRLPPNGLAVLISDGYDASRLQPALIRLAQVSSRQVVFVHLANEAAPLGDAHGRAEGALRLIDSETQEELAIEDLDAVRAAYVQAYDEHLEAWRTLCARHNITYVRTQAGEHLVDRLLAHLHHTGIIW